MSRYAEAHAHPKGVDDARPTALQIIEDEGLVNKLSDKVFLVTGVSSGIGIETLKALHATGAHVFGTVRDAKKGQKVVDDILTEGSNGGKITLIDMSLDSSDSIREGAKQFLSQSNKLNVLINNAGVMATPEGKTKDGFETQFGTNHVGHFLLFQLLKPTLLASATSEFPSRVVSVSSIGHRISPIRFDDYNFTEAGSYQPWLGYGQAKTANIYLANEIERRYGSKNLHATSLHPGGINTGLQVHVDPELQKAWDAPEIKPYFKSPAQGASTSVYCAVSKEWADKGGKYLSDCLEQGLAQNENPLAGGDDGHAAHAYNPEGEARLWKDSLKMVGLEDDQ